MKRLFYSLAILCAVSLVAYGAEISLVPEPGPYQVNESYDILVGGIDNNDARLGAVILYPRTATLKKYKTWDDRFILVFKAKQQGEYLIAVVMPSDSTGGAIRYKEIILPVGTNPNPPDPPNPPTPIPTALRVLAVYESDDLDTMPKEQSAIILNPQVRDYLDAKCVRDNGEPAYRFYDRDVLDKLPQRWSVATEAIKGKPTPWLVILGESSGQPPSLRFSGPWPSTPSAMLELLQQHGGK